MITDIEDLVLIKNEFKNDINNEDFNTHNFIQKIKKCHRPIKTLHRIKQDNSAVH